MKILFFRIMLNEALKMISADVKTNLKQQEIIPSKLETQCKKGEYFSFDFGCTPSSLILSVKNKVTAGFCN